MSKPQQDMNLDVPAVGLEHHRDDDRSQGRGCSPSKRQGAL
ncbi:MAG: LpxI family protein [Desulfobacterales bacterium]|nr:LpxI family protein [Desulfobacterales bacterium]